MCGMSTVDIHDCRSFVPSTRPWIFPGRQPVVGQSGQMLRTGSATTSSTAIVSWTKKGSPYSVRISEP